MDNGARCVAEMMSLVHPTDDDYDNLSMKQKHNYHLRCILAYKGMKTCSSGKVQQEYNKNLRHHIKMITNLFRNEKI